MQLRPNRNDRESFCVPAGKPINIGDIGLDDWLFDLDIESEVERIVPTVLAVAMEPQAAKEKARRAKIEVERLQASTMNQLRIELLHSLS